MPQVLVIRCLSGTPVAAFHSVCSTSLGSTGVGPRDAETDPPPCLTHCLPCRTEACHPPLLPCSPRLTITPEKPTPLAQKPPAGKARCNIPPTAASKDFSQDPRGKFLFQAAQAAPSPAALQGLGGPLTPQGSPGSLGTAAPATLACITLSISHPSSRQLIRKRRHQPWRGSQRETTLQLSNRAVTLQLRIALLRETNPSR